jgi:hypothetical protein
MSVSVIALCALAAGGGARQQGVVLEQKVVHSMRSLVGMVTREETVRLSFSPAGVRSEPARGGSPTIFRVERGGRVTRIEANAITKTYREEDLAERRRTNERLKGAMAKTPRPPTGGLLGMLAGMGKENEAAASGAAKPPVTTRPIAKSRSIAGRACTGVAFFRDGKKIFEAWYTKTPAPKWMVRYDLGEAPGADDAGLMKARRQQKGIELESTMPLAAGGTHRVTTTKYAVRRIGPSTFKPPAGYRKKPRPGAQKPNRAIR